jgi:ankyrin repeat protein
MQFQGAPNRQALLEQLLSLKTGAAAEEASLEHAQEEQGLQETTSAGCEASIDMLFSACALGNVGIVSEVLGLQSVNVNAPCEENGYTPLHYACSSGDAGVVKLLCERGAIVDTKSTKGETPVLVAAQRGHLEVVQYLCESHNALVLGNQDSLDFWKRMLPDIRGKEDMPLPLATSGSPRSEGETVDEENLAARRKLVFAWLSERLSPDEATHESSPESKGLAEDNGIALPPSLSQQLEQGTEDQSDVPKERVSFVTLSSDRSPQASRRGSSEKADSSNEISRVNSHARSSSMPAKRVSQSAALTPTRTRAAIFLPPPFRDAAVRGRVRSFLRSRAVLVVMLIALTLALYMPDVPMPE